MNLKTCYVILHINNTATEQEIKRSYRRLANIYHPDKAGGNESKFKIITNAYKTIMKDIKYSGSSNTTKTKTNTYHDREMPMPEFIFINVTDEKAYYILEIRLCNVSKLSIGNGISWNIPHEFAYAKTAQKLRLKIHHEDAKYVNYKFKVTLTGTDGKSYESNEKFTIPKPKSKIEKIIDKLW